MEKLIITAAICGAEVTKQQNIAVPYTVAEMVREARSAYDAGASIIHVHVRWDDGTPTQDRERFRVVMDAIRAELPDVIMIPSTGGATGMKPEERLQPTELFPEMATLDCGTCNFGDEIFDNTMPTMRAFGKRMIENHIKPEYERFEMGHLDTILNKILLCIIDHRAVFILVEYHLYLMYAALYIIYITGEYYLSIVKKCSCVAYLVYLFEVMRRDYCCQLTVKHCVNKHFLDNDTHSGIKSVKRFIKQKIISTAGKPYYYYCPTLHAL